MRLRTEPLDAARSHAADRTDELASAIAARDALLAMIGDELRNPMCALLLDLTSVLAKIDDTPLAPASLRARLLSLERHTRAFVRRTGVLLDVPRLLDGSFRPDRALVCLSDVVSGAVQELRPQAQRARCSLVVDVGLQVAGWWDAAAIQQVTHAFVVRMMQYGAGRPVTVMVTAEDDVAHLTVRGAGEGPSAAERARVFEAFERAMSSEPRAGLVLDLWICRQLIEAHGGRILLDDHSGGGSVFTATLPRRTQDAEP